jgi:hypothetical protein
MNLTINNGVSGLAFLCIFVKNRTEQEMVDARYELAREYGYLE